MDTARYKAFVASVDAGSFSAAAEKINYSPSGVSQLVNALEKEFGFTLLSRGKHGVRLTAEGRKILPLARSLVQKDEHLLQLISEINGLSTGSISIGAYSSIATHWLPPVIKEFQESFPNVEIRMREGIRQEVLGWMQDKLIDVAFCSYKSHDPYMWIPLDWDPLYAYLPKEHPLANAKVYPLNRLSEEKFIMPALGKDSDITELFKRTHHKPASMFTTLENFVVLSMIENNMGMSIMNGLIAERLDYDVVRIPLDPPERILLSIALPSLQDASPVVKRFVSFTKDRLQKVEGFQ